MRVAVPISRFLLLLPAAAMLLLPGAVRAATVKWIDPTPAELAMKSEPKAPGAPAIILSYTESDDANSAEVLVHVRLKVLTEGGLSAGTVNVPDRIVRNDKFDQEFFGRTIHPDGSVVVFQGTPQNSTTVDEFYGTRKVIALPAVTVGSILEYGYHFESQNTVFTYLIGYYNPIWRVQQRYFVRSASFTLKAPEPAHSPNPWLPSYGPEDVRWVANLPPGAQVIKAKGSFILNMEDIPAPAIEEFMPPPTSAFYNVRFFYYDKKQDRYWGESGDRVDARWIDFDKPTPLLKRAVQDLILPSDNDDAKLTKLYQAVEKLENTDLSREHSKHEEKAEGEKTGDNADAIWTNKRGNSGELTLLFVALARAAGYPAYPMAVASRDHAVFDQSVLSWNQMDAMVAIVNINGHEAFFDPGTRMCPIGHMAPAHGNVVGVSTEAKVVKIRATPEASYKANITDRAAELTLAANGAVNGKITIVWQGNAGLAMRRQVLREDAHAVETAAEKQLQSRVPEGVEVKLVTLTGLDDATQPLTGTFSVTGKLGVATGKRVILPAQFFASTGKRMLAPETRTQPLAFPESYVTRDRIILVLPAELAVEALPQPHTASVAKDTVYQAKVDSGTAKQYPGKTLLVAQRALLLNRIDYKPEEYATLHKYFGDVAAGDGEQIVLKPAAAAETSRAGTQ